GHNGNERVQYRIEPLNASQTLAGEFNRRDTVGTNLFRSFSEGEHEGRMWLQRRPFPLLLTLFADAVDLKSVAGRKVFVFAADFLLDTFDAMREKLHRGATFGAHH